MNQQTQPPLLESIFRFTQFGIKNNGKVVSGNDIMDEMRACGMLMLHDSINPQRDYKVVQLQDTITFEPIGNAS